MVKPYYYAYTYCMKNLAALIVLAIVVGLGIISLIFLWPQSEIELSDATSTSTPPVTEPIEKPKETIGSLFMIGHWADTPVASTTALIRDHQIGGVIIMSAPKDPEKIKSWIQEWNSVSDVPLIIAIDQEGGPVTRLKGADFIQTGQREITTEEEAYQVGLERGQELAALGITMNFAPVLDTAQDPNSFMYTRVFPGDTAVAKLAAAMSRGLREGGVIPVAKHFPGHDDTNEDSHLLLPTVNIPAAELYDFTKPFADYIRIDKPTALMTAHVLFSQIDDQPATLSSFFLQDFLRDELGFTGVIFTDDMSMDAIDTNWTSSEASVLALEAGADIILFAAEPTEVTGAIETVEEAIANGRLSTAVLADTYVRIETLR